MPLPAIRTELVQTRLFERDLVLHLTFRLTLRTTMMEFPQLDFTTRPLPG